MRKLRDIFTRPSRQENDANEELRFHLEKQIEQNIAAGMSPGEARRQAMIAFGGVQQTRETLREIHRGRFLESLLQDSRYAWRMLRKSPAFTIIAVATLALGIGANTAIFSLIDAVAFRSLPVPDPQGLIIFQWLAHQRPETNEYRGGGDCRSHLEEASGCSLPLPFFKDVHAQTSVFSHLAAYTPAQLLDLSGNGPAQIVRGDFVSGDFFPTLGVHSHVGRLLTEADDAPEAPAVAVLNYEFWQKAFGGSASAVGKTIRVNGVPFTIVGVTEPGFDRLTLSNSYDLWLPLTARTGLIPGWSANDEQMDHWSLIILGRVKPGVPVTQAQAAVSLIFSNEMVHGAKPIFKPEHEPAIRLAVAAPLFADTQKGVLQPFYVMMMCVGLVLLIACANVSGLLLARSAARQREIAVCLALGAKRSRLVRQLLTESLMLSIMGGALGLLLAVWGARLLMMLVSAGSSTPLGFGPQLDWRVLAFTAAVAVIAGVVFGLAPALRGSDIGLTSSLKSGDASPNGGQNSHRRLTLGGALVATQMALAIVVLVTAGLLVRTLTNLKRLNPGFDTQNVLLFSVDPRLAGYKGPQIDNLYRDLQEQLSSIPGVTSVTYSWMPLLSGALSSTSFHRPGTPPDSKDQVDSDELPVGPNFFKTLGIPLRLGRDFTSADFAAAAANAGDKPGLAPTPVIVNQAFVRSYFPKSDPLGARFGDTAPTDPGEPKTPGFQIVGVAGDAKYDSLRREVSPTFYGPSTGSDAVFQLRTATNPTSILPAVRNIVRHQNEDLALSEISTQTEAIDRQLSNERITAQLSTFFGLLALVLACLGLYGLLSYEVTRRTREIGIRMAVGAQSHNVVRLVLAKAVGLILAGSLAGIAVALGVTKLLASFLFGVSAGDPVTLVAVTGLLAAVALIACYLPARRATRVDPLVALRYE